MVSGITAEQLARAMKIEAPNNSEIGWIHAADGMAHFSLRTPYGQTFRILIVELAEEEGDDERPAGH